MRYGAAWWFNDNLRSRERQLVEDGLYPDDEKTLGSMARDICFKNAADFFNCK